jgi:branched-chain amino acid transport system ATP-binding protein
MIQIRDLNAGYGKFQILYNVSLDIMDKAITSVVGPNGSGKSTLLKSIFGLTSIYGGVIKFKDKIISNLPPHEVARLGIAYLPQVDNVYLNLTVRENLIMAGYTLNKNEVSQRINEVLEFVPQLKEMLDKRAYNLSGGERQMLTIAAALIRQPSVMLLDEPTSNLSPKLSARLFEKVKEINEALGVTIVVVEQNTKKALEYSDYSCLLVAGRVRYFGPSQELLANKELGRLFLGI